LDHEDVGRSSFAKIIYVQDKCDIGFAVDVCVAENDSMMLADVQQLE